MVQESAHIKDGLRLAHGNCHLLSHKDIKSAQAELLTIAECTGPVKPAMVIRCYTMTPAYSR